MRFIPHLNFEREHFFLLTRLCLKQDSQTGMWKGNLWKTSHETLLWDAHLSLLLSHFTRMDAVMNLTEL